jgi:hypothetical protein
LQWGCAGLPTEVERISSLGYTPELPRDWEGRGGAVVGQVVSVGDTLGSPDVERPTRFPQVWISRVHSFPSSLWKREDAQRFVGDSVGRFVIAPLAPGTYRMDVRSYSHEFKTRSFSVETGELLRIVWKARVIKLNGKWVLTST